MRLKVRLKVILAKSLITSSVFLFICEYLIYPIVLNQCSWPDHDDTGKTSETLRAMFLADTHLLGPFRGHWFDKLRREWQMHRAFQTAMTLFQPEVVFFLGDVFDEGNWVNQEYFDKYMSRFEELFSVKSYGKIRRHIISGNHDIGFHYEIVPYLHQRFHEAFNTSSVRLLKLKKSNFLLLNSMAMEMDGCFLCDEAMKSLRKVSAKLKCEEDPLSCSETGVHKPTIISRPILLQHFPLYRKSDEACSGEDAAPENEKNVTFRTSFDCLSKESSDLLLKMINPRLIMSGHTHHHCISEHTVTQKDGSNKTVTEYSVPSFSWRNRNDPSFYLAIITPTNFELSKCYLPKESTVYWLYSLGCVILLAWGLLIPNSLYSGYWYGYVRRRFLRFSFPRDN